MAITWHGSVAVPVDGAAATNAATPVTITPPASMVVGDLVQIVAQQRGTATFSISVTGGQVWYPLFRRTTTNLAIQGFWCRFNGTWAANPAVAYSATVCNSAIMHVFRPSASGYAWGIDQAEVFSTYTAPTTPFTVTRAGQTTTKASTVSIAGFFSVDDNTWGSISGAGWNVLGDAQYRNTAGSDISAAFAYKIQTSAAATGSVSLNQSTLGGDAGGTTIITFYEYDPGALYPTNIIRNNVTDGTLELAITGAAAGCRLVAVITQPDATNFPDPTVVNSSAGLTWTRVVDAEAANSGNAEIWTAIFTAGGSETVTFTWTGSASNIIHGMLVEVNGQESTAGGQTAVATAQTSPNLSITTGRNKSLVVGAVSDWNVNDGASRVIRNNAIEVDYLFSSGNFTSYLFFKIVETAGAESFGYSAPTMTGAGAGVVLYEIRLPAGGASQDLTPGLFTNTSTIYAPTVNPGAVNLTPGLFTNTPTIYAPSLGLGPVALTPGLFTNTPLIYSPTVTPGAVDLTPGLYTNTPIIYAPSIEQGPATITPPFYENVSVIFAPDIVPGPVDLTPGLHINTPVIFAPDIVPGSVNLTAPLFTNVPVIYPPYLSTGAYNITPPLYTNTPVIYPPSLDLGAVNLTPGLYTNTPVIFPPSISFGAPQDLTPPVFINSPVIYAPTIGVGAVTLAPGLHINGNIIYAPSLAPGPVILTPPFYENVSVLYLPTIRTGTAALKRWNGTAWVNVNSYVWTGQQWAGNKFIFDGLTWIPL